MVAILLHRFPSKYNSFIFNELKGLKVKFRIYSMGSPDEDDLDAFNLRGMKITYIQKEGLIQWSLLTKDNVPFGCNEPFRNMPPAGKERDQLLRHAVNDSKTALAVLLYKMKQDKITKIYAPFGGMEADLALMLSNHLKIPFYYTVHAYDLFVAHNYGNIKATRAEHIFAISEHNKQYLIDNFNADPDKITVKRVQFIKKAVRSKNIPYKYIFSAGRLVHMKGFSHAIRAFREYHEVHPEEHYIIAGDGPYKNILLNLIEAVGMQDYIHLIGHIKNAEVLRYIKGSKFCMLTSVTDENNDKEGIPTFFIEAMSRGVPCIGTSYSGILELLDNTFKEGSHDSILECMLGDKVSGRPLKKKINDLFNNKQNSKLLTEKLR